MTFITKVLLLCFPILLTIGFATTNVVVSVNILLLKASETEAFRIYDLNLLAFVLNKFDFWGPKCPNYLNIEF